MVAVGWTKYKKALPVTKATAVRALSSTTPTSNIVEMRSLRCRRRASAKYDHTRAANRAPRNPATTSTT